MPSRALAASGLPTAAPELSQATEPPQTTPEAYGSCHRGIPIFPGAQILGEYAPRDLLTEPGSIPSPRGSPPGVPEQVHAR